MTVTRSQLAGRMKSKLDVYKVLTKEGQYFLPPFNECSMKFVSDIIMGKKKAFKNSEIMLVDVPCFRELSATAMMELVERDLHI